MGERGRRIRKLQKKLAHDSGYRENEIGELKAYMSKAEARRRHLRGVEGWFAFEAYTIHQMSEQIAEEIDREVMNELSKQAQELSL